MGNAEKIINYIRINGPSLPTQIAKLLETDSIIASAMLSDLVSKGLIKISSLKKGGSPLYYLPNRERDLEKFSTELSGYEKEAYELLKKDKILLNKQLSPQHRVAMSNIKDFAKPVVVKLGDGTEIKFFKWYELSNEDASEIIRERFFSEKIKETDNKKTQNEKKPEPVEQESSKETKTKQEKISEDSGLKNPKGIQDFEKPKHGTEQNQADEEDMQSNLNLNQLPEDIKKALSKNKLIAEDYEPKGRYAALVCHVDGFPSHKLLLYFIGKKRVNEKDVGLAFSMGYMKKKPLFLVSKGELTKEAEKFINRLGINFLKLD